MTGFKMRPEFNQNTDKQAISNYSTVKTGGAIQDDLRNVNRDDGEERPAADKVTDKFSDNAGDNALTRYEINRSIVSPEVANEHSYVNAMEKEIEAIGRTKKP